MKDFYIIKRQLAISIVVSVVFLVLSCKTQHVIIQPIPENPYLVTVPQEPLSAPVEERPALNLSFTGDIMAHPVNTSMKMYSDIYGDVKEVLTNDDLSFANLETPIVNSLPVSGYPRFNAHSEYLQAAIDAGFDVLSLANNHSNDQGVEGIDATLDEVQRFAPVLITSGLYSAQSVKMEPVLIEKKGWRILFLSITEILNSHDISSKRVYYLPQSPYAQKAFLSEIQFIRSQIPCDLFILSVHILEPEYVRTVSTARKTWFRELSQAGIDIIWAHHPHVLQEWYTFKLEQREILVMHSMGNFISGQRYDLNYEEPSAVREYTGDGLLLRVTVNRTEFANSLKMLLSPVLLTNLTIPGSGVVVKQFSENFVNSLQGKQKIYYQTRLSLLYKEFPFLLASTGTAILKE